MAWTTLEEEAALLASLSESARVAVDVIGRSSQGRDIRLVRIGDPAPPEPTNRALILFVGLQHGDEPAGREALLNLCSHLASTADADEVGLLQQYGVLVIPTVNPDGFLAGTRNNADNLNINRDHITLATSEARAVAQVLGRARPVVVADMHESIDAIDPGNEIEWAHPRNPMCDPALVAHAQAMIAAMESRANSENWDNGEYRFDPEQEERVLHNTATLRNGVGVLVETNFADDSEPGQALRLEIQEAMVEEILAYVVDTADDLVSEADAAASRATAAGAAQGPFDLRTIVLEPAPLGYRLTGVIPLAYLASFNVDITSTGVIPMAQPARTVIPYLFDPQAQFVVVPAERLFELPTPGVVATVQEFAPVVTGSHRMVVEAYVLRELASGDDPGGEPIPILGGEVVMDGTADVQRTLALTTGGVDFPRRIGDLLLPDGTEIFVRRGVDIGADILWAPLGYYRIETPEQDDAPDGPIVIRGFDRMKGLIDSPLLAPRQFTEGDTFADVFASLVGDVYPGATVLFDDDLGDEELGRVLLVEQSRYEPLRTLAQGRGKVVYWDGEGVLRVETAPDPSEPSWEVRAGRDGVLSRARRRITRTDVVNAVVVRSQASRERAPARAVAIDDGPQSVTRFGGRFGVVPLHITVPVETTTAQAQNAAAATLLRRAGLPFQVEVESVPNPALKPYDPFRVTLRDGQREQHVAERIALPLTARGVMRIASREQRGSLVRVVQQ